MTLLKTKIIALLDKCGELLIPRIHEVQKYVIVTDTTRKAVTFINKNGSLRVTYGVAREQIKNLQSYKEARAEFEKDRVFSVVAKIKTDNYYTFGRVIEHLIINAASIKKNIVVIDNTKAIHVLDDLRNTLAKKTLKYEASARLIGVTLTAKSFALPDGITIHRLTKKELNDRQPFASTLGSEYLGLLDHPAELRVSVSVPIDYAQTGLFSHSFIAAKNIVHKQFTKIVEAILVATSGYAKLTAVTLISKGGIDMSSGFHVLREMPMNVDTIIRKGDIDNISAAYDLVSGGRKIDKTLERALHRFLLGRERSDLVDKLVDYVIAWEAILLTSSGSPGTHELSYKFSLNGALIISSACRNKKPCEIFKKMRYAYDARSKIVHGGSEGNIKRILKDGGFTDINGLCDFLELYFCRIVFWLARMNADERPYRKKGGWESLIWT